MEPNAIDPILPRPVPVRRILRETHDTVTIHLDVSGPEGFRFEPGQFNMLYAFGVGEIPISVSGDSGRPECLVHTIRSVGATSAALAAARPGDALGVRGPYGRGWPVAQAHARDLLVVAGGLGLAPLRPVLYEVVRARQRFGQVALLYGARTPEDLLYRRELEQWRQTMNAQVIVDRAEPGWTGSVGVAPSLLSRVTVDPASAVAMVCGPEVMMRFTIRELTRLGMRPGQIFVSLERNMKCAVGFCGHCQYGPSFVCKDGPVYSYADIEWLFARREI